MVERAVFEAGLCSEYVARIAPGEQLRQNVEAGGRALVDRRLELPVRFLAGVPSVGMAG